LDRFLVTDTTPFPGFSGGPLIDSFGSVVGLNTSGLMHGAAITIPSSLAWVDAENLAKHGYIKRGYLGIRSQTVALSSEMQSALGRTQESGLLLVSVEPDSPSSSGGLMVGDILVTLDGKPIAGHDELMILLTGIDVGSTAAVEVLRGGKPHTVNVTVGERK
jgi:S1-C subfamily serine protease